MTSTNEPRRAGPGGGSRGPDPASGGWAERVTRRDAQSPLRVTFARHPGTLRFDGIIDESTRTLLRTALARAAISTRDELRIDMAGVAFCDLAGLRAIVSLASQLGPARRVTLAGLPGEAGAMLRILGWDATPGLAVRPARPDAQPAAPPQPEAR